MELDGTAQWAVDVMEKLGAPGVAVLIALENLFPPLPSEIILPLAGFTASRGEMSFVAALLWATFGSLAGAVLLYLIGAWIGRNRMRWVAEKLPLVDVADVDRAEDFFNRHGAQAVFFGRMIPIFRSLISIPAGIERLALWLFCLLTALGSGLWNTLFVTAGYLLGENWSAVLRYADAFKVIVIVAVVAAVAWFVARRLLARRRAAAGGRGAGS